MIGTQIPHRSEVIGSIKKFRVTGPGQDLCANLSTEKVQNPATVGRSHCEISCTFFGRQAGEKDSDV